MRVVPGFLLALSLTLPLARAADPVPPAGNWKLNVPVGEGRTVVFLIALSEKDGKWAGEVAGVTMKLKVRPKVADLAVTGENVKFAIDVGDQRLLAFDGVLGKDGKKIAGSMAPLGGKLQLTELRPSKLKDLGDPFELARET